MVSGMDLHRARSSQRSTLESAAKLAPVRLHFVHIGGEHIAGGADADSQQRFRTPEVSTCSGPLARLQMSARGLSPRLHTSALPLKVLSKLGVIGGKRRNESICLQPSARLQTSAFGKPRRLPVSALPDSEEMDLATADVCSRIGRATANVCASEPEQCPNIRAELPMSALRAPE